jgi:1-acyl-sn-glycerol-3-phosphate acyltransferase
MNLKQLLSQKSLLPEHIEEVFETLEKRYKDYHDPWGLDFKKAIKSLKLLWPMYKYYFRVRLFGQENIEDKPYMVTSNHTGQIAIDGMLLSIAFLMDIEPPRILRGMIERFMVKIPFIGTMAAESGSVLGDRENCLFLLEKGESIMVFPEGVPGIAKDAEKFYELQHFTRGFFRLALQTKTDILPVAIVGAEEMYPGAKQHPKLAKFLKLPTLPTSYLFPWLGPLGLLPLPSPIDIYIGKPYPVPQDLDENALDSEIDAHIVKIKEQINEMIKQGLKERRPFLENLGLKDKRD